MPNVRVEMRAAKRVDTSLRRHHERRRRPRLRHPRDRDRRHD
jgi:hypothetical protein